MKPIEEKMVEELLSGEKEPAARPPDRVIRDKYDPSLEREPCGGGYRILRRPAEY